MKDLIAQHKRTISPDFLKAAHKTHDGVSQVLAQRGYASMTHADATAQFYYDEKDYLQLRAKTYKSMADPVASANP